MGTNGNGKQVPGDAIRLLQEYGRDLPGRAEWEAALQRLELILLDVSSLVGGDLDIALVTEAVNAAAADLDAMSDLHASAAYRRRVAVALCIRAMEQARGHAADKPAKGTP